MSKEIENVEVVNEEVEEVVDTTITTKDAIKAIAHNTKVGAVKAWDRAKPKLKKAVVAAAIFGGGLWAYDKLTQQPTLEKSDDDWGVDDDIVADGEATVLGTESETPAETVTNDVTITEF